MNTELLDVYLSNPNKKQIRKVADTLQSGGVVVYPTDTIYGLGADIKSKSAIERIFRIKKVSQNKLLSLICSDLSEVSVYAHISNRAHKLMKKVLPGPYTFILPASKDVPKGILDKRKTIGIRIPDSEVTQAIIEELGRPILSTSVPKGSDDYYTDPEEIAINYNKQIDIVLNGGVAFNEPSTIIDFTGDFPELIREGAGSADNLF